MARNFEAELFGQKQAHLESQEAIYPVRTVRPVQAVYLDVPELGVDMRRRLWVPKNAPAYQSSEALARAQDGDDLCRLIVLPRKMLVDLSVGSFTLGGENPQRFVVDADNPFETADWRRATGIIRTDEQRSFAESFIQKRYKVPLPPNVLELALATDLECMALEVEDLNLDDLGEFGTAD